ncbi:unnamed protein product [Mesocestoides corti]|uniref:EF-hand domain-containing protein n=2 Tax=Mesocestoides corti TaxID=53468 RepID=A0A0R3U935_MESCO|nr:unnamed protein product [Mesocestoides corti]
MLVSQLPSADLLAVRFYATPGLKVPRCGATGSLRLLKDTAETITAKPVPERIEPIVKPVLPSTPVEPTPVTESPTTAKADAAVKPEETVVSSKDLDSIKDAIESIAESKKAMQDEHLLDLKADLDEAIKIRQQQQKEAEVVTQAPTVGVPEAPVTASAETPAKPPPVVETPPEKPKEAVAAEHPVPVVEEPKEPTVLEDAEEAKAMEAAEEEEEKKAAVVAAKKAAKTEKAVQRLGAQVDRLLGEIDGLMEKLRGQKKDLLEEIQAQEVKAKEVEKDEEEKKRIIDSIRADQQRVVGINEILASLQSMQKVAGTEGEASERWQRILDALDEDHDGKIEFKHLLPVFELFEKEKVELYTSQLSDVVEMFEKEDLLEERQVEKEAAEQSEKANGSSTSAADNGAPKSKDL